MSVFLMGLYDKSRDKFCTVAKCGNGHDDTTIARLQKELDMVKISKVGVVSPPTSSLMKTLGIINTGQPPADLLPEILMNMMSKGSFYLHSWQ